MHTKRNLFLKLITCCQLLSYSDSAMHLYGSEHYNDWLGPFDFGNQPCVNLPSLFRNRIDSIKTDDCIKAYTGLNCEGYSYQFIKGNYQDLRGFQHQGGPNMHDLINSIGQCRSPLAGTHVQFYYGNELILEFKNLCQRVDLGPVYSQATKIDNHGSCLILDRSTTDFRLLPGKSYFSEQIKNIATYGSPIVGISPCYQTDACHIISLSATVVHFTVTDPKKESMLDKTSDLSLATTTVFINDGWATVSQEYKATKTIKEVTEVTMIKSFSKMKNWMVGTGVEVELKTGSFLFGIESSLKTSFSFSTTGEETEQNEESNTRRHEKSTEFSVNQKIEIEPCTKYKVDSYVKVKERYPMVYNVTFEVTGKKGDAKMTAKEIRSELGNLSFVRNKNAITVVASEISEIYLDFGVETVIDGKGEILVECRNKQLETRPVVSYVNISSNAFKLLPLNSLNRTSPLNPNLSED